MLPWHHIQVCSLMVMADKGESRSNSRSSQGSTVDDISLPSPRYCDDEAFVMPERCSSESDLTPGQNLDNLSTLNVEEREFILGKGVKIKVFWDIKDEVGASDWIGLFLTGVTDPSKFWDSKTRGINGGHKGEITWELDTIAHCFTGEKTKICFKYYQGNSGDLIATSPAVTVLRPIAAEQLRTTLRIWTFSP
ncbi:hypothetical protein CHS0354_019684 [Potamilus streckersoni]|uniref:E3 ubiquitin-protein ligase HECW1/2 N-terminal domain-containing protein n=1 Tax=Potamilus streckersoni TaxID=2493646 RepID=A0AAE0VRT4_9BIVA|nr:hypothetical protein CHS0354_019684 [Potamilus streckersoni]